MYDESWQGNGYILIARDYDKSAELLARMANWSRVTRVITWPLTTIFVLWGRLLKLKSWQVDSIFRWYPKGKDEPIRPFVRVLLTRPRIDVSNVLMEIQNTEGKSEDISSVRLQLFRWKVEFVTGVGSTFGVNSFSGLRTYAKVYEEQQKLLPAPD